MAGPKKTNFLAGCVKQSVSRITGTLVGLYASVEAGMESDPDYPWSTVCEPHNTLVCHETRALAERTMPDPSMFCDECREALAAKEKLPENKR